MTNLEKKPEAKADPFGLLRDIGKILAEGAAKHPVVAGLNLLVLIAAVVTIFIGGGEVVILFFALTGIVACFIFLMGRRSQKEQIRHYVSVEAPMRHDTLRLLNELERSKKDEILIALRGAATDVADALNLPVQLIRSNVFGLDENNRMRMVREITFQMDREEELTVSMPVGYGSTGRCFQSGRANIAVFRGGWGKDVIEDQELRKVHPDLQWIISVPVLTGRDELRPIAVLNVDGLQKRLGEDQLRIALARMFHWSQAISLIIARQ